MVLVPSAFSTSFLPFPASIHSHLLQALCICFLNFVPSFSSFKSFASASSTLHLHSMGSKPHILAMPFPAQGHMSSMLHLCKKIAAEGFIVTYLNVDSIYEQLKQNWVAPPGLDVRLDSITFDWKIPRGFDDYCMANLVSFFDAIESLGPALAEVVDRLSTEVAPVLGIVSDYFLPFTQKVADDLEIPRTVVSTGAANWVAVEYHVEELMRRGLVPVKESRLGSQERIVGLKGLTPFRSADIPAYLRLDEPRWMEITLNRVAAAKKAHWFLANSFYDLEKDSFDFLAELHHKCLPVGPIFLLDKNPANVVLRTEDEKCLEWLETKANDSVLYISFGSIAVLSAEQFDELAQALEAAKQPFLWVIRPELVVGGVTGDSYSGFCERTKEQGYINAWAPQLKVLAHPAIGGFLSHCGWNSTIESISNGVPLLGWPWAAEQNWNLKHVVEDWKVAQPVTPGENGLIRKDEIEQKVKLLMQGKEGQEMRKNALSIKKKARQAVAEGGLSQKNLKEVLAFLVENANKPSANGST